MSKPIFHFDIIQGSEEWHELRMGRITGSVAKTFLVNGKGERGFGVGAFTELYKMLEERLTGVPRENFSNKATDWGHEYESEAVEEYQRTTFRKVVPVGFVEKNEFIGASPDGLIPSIEKGLEAKCLPKEHMKVVDSNEPIKDHVTQCQFNLWVTGYKSWDLVYYHPNLPKSCKSKIFVIEPNVRDFTKFEERSGEFIKMLNERLKKYQS